MSKTKAPKCKSCPKGTYHFTGLCVDCRKAQNMKVNGAKNSSEYRRYSFDALGFAKDVRDSRNRVVKVL